MDSALHNVNFIIEPPAVRRGQHATLRCIYDLEGAPLYSAKFYRGQLEFYRYTPGEHPNTKVFPFPGIYVDVSVNVRFITNLIRITWPHNLTSV